MGTYHIIRALGQGTSNILIITSAAFALISFLYIFTVGSYFKVITYVLENRVTYPTFFIDKYIISQYVDHIIIAFGMILWLGLSVRGKVRLIVSTIYGGLTVTAVLANLSILFDIVVLMSFPIIISFLVYNKFAYKKVLNTHTNLSVNYLAIIGIATGIVGLIISLAPSLFSLPLTSIPIRNYAYDIFLLLSIFSPIFMVLLIFSFPIKLLMKEFTSKIKIKNKTNESLLAGDGIKSRTKIFIFLSLFMILSVILALIPHQLTINKDNQQVGLDTGIYVYQIYKMAQSNDIQEFLSQAFIVHSAGDRPLTLIFLFTIVKLSNVDIVYIIEHSPIILGPALVLVVYFLTRELTSNVITSLLASFLTAISFHTLIGIYAGFYANWLALIIGYLSFVFLIRFLKEPSKLDLTLFSTLIILLMFTHLYTWTILIIVMGIFLVVMLKLYYYRRKSVILLLLVVFSSIVIDIARMTIIGSSSGIERDIAVASTGGAGLAQYALRWRNLIDTIHFDFGGQFSNFIILILGSYWVFRSNMRDPSTIFLVIFLSIAAIPLFFGDRIILTRVLYNIPFQIPAAIALTYVKKQTNGTMILLPICIWLIFISIIAVSNFYLILP